MREIFRGKRFHNGEWIDGSAVWFDEDKCFIMPQYQGASSLSYAQIFASTAVMVDSATVGQYTGLTDKNGAKIFEGDIVETDLKRPYLIVEFRDGCFMFNCNDGEKDYYDIMHPILDEPQTIYEYGKVIGNIYDNRELLKGGNEQK